MTTLTGLLIIAVPALILLVMLKVHLDEVREARRRQRVARDIELEKQRKFYR